MTRDIDPNRWQGTDEPTLPPRPMERADDDGTLPPDPLGTAETVGGAADAALVGDLSGRRFADYELLVEIARGGMGVVYKARQLSLNRIVAIKMILAGELAGVDDVRRFRVEAEAAAGLDHPGIVPIYEVGQFEGQHYFSMGFVEGTSLAALVARGPLPPREAAELVRQVAEAVQYAHDKGVVHRDLKPANILLQPHGLPSGPNSRSTASRADAARRSAWIVKVTDFGLAKRVETQSGLTTTGQVLGTPSFMPPEQASGKNDQIGPCCDVYSAGAVLYTLLTGRPPFQAETALDTLLAVIERDPVPPRRLSANIPRDLETIALTCLQKEPARRYASARALADDLTRFLNDEPIQARPATLAYKAWRKVKRNRAATLAGIALLTCVVVAFALAWHAQRKSGEAAVASTAVADVRQALERVRQETGIQQLAVLPFNSLTSDAGAEWIGPAFAAELESQLAGHERLKIMGKGIVEEAAAALGFAKLDALDESQLRRLGEKLVVDHLVAGHFQQIGGELQVSAKIVNLRTGAIERAGMQVRGKFPDAVFDLQANLTRQCLAKLGVADVAQAQNVVQVLPTPPDIPAPAAVVPSAAKIEAWVLLGQGEHALARHEYDEAVQLLSEAIEKDPQLWKAYRSLGLAYRNLDRSDDAAVAFRKALALQGDDVVSAVYYNLLSGRASEGFAALRRAKDAGLADLDMFKLSIGQRFAALGLGHGTLDPQVADELEKAVEKHPRDEDLWILLAAAYGVLKNVDKALDTLQRAIAANPGAGLLHLWLAVAKEQDHRPDEAQRHREDAERLRPPGAQGFREFGAVYLQVGQFERALNEFDQARKLDPNSGAIDVMLGQSLASSDPRRALQHFQSALDREPKSALVLSALCRLSNLLGDNDKSSEYARRWIEADPESYEAHQYLRMAYLRNGRPVEAADEAQKIERLTPTHASFFFFTGNALMQGRQFDEAIAVLGRGHKEFSDDRDIAGLLHLAQGTKQAIEGRWPEAIRLLKQSQSELPGVIDSAVLLVDGYRHTGQWSDATDQAMRIIEREPRYFPQAAEVFRQSRRYDDAVRAAEAALRADSKDMLLRELLLEFYALAAQKDKALEAFEQLPLATTNDTIARARLAALLADRLEATGAFDRASKSKWLSGTVDAMRQKAQSLEGIDSAVFDKLDRWVATGQSWLVAGPLPLEATPPEMIDPEAMLASARGPVAWHAVACRPGAYVDLGNLYPGSNSVAAFAVSFVTSDETQKVRFSMGSDDGVVIWLNGEQLFEHHVLRGFKPGDDKAEATLRPGLNQLVLKIEQGAGDWGFGLEALDDRGWPVALQWSTDPSPEIADARIVAQTIFDRLLLRDAVKEQISADACLSEAARSRALAFVDRFEESGPRLAGSAGDIVKDANRTAAEYDLALRQAEAACRLDPKNIDDRAILGAAQYRTGDAEAAVQILKACELQSVGESGSPTPWEVGFLALAFDRIGDAALAFSYRNRLRDLMLCEQWNERYLPRLLYREVKERLPSSTEDSEIEDILRTVYAAEQAGWLHHDADGYLRMLADELRSSGGRGPLPGDYDLSADRRQVERALRLFFQYWPPPGVRTAYQTVAVEAGNGQARLEFRSIVQIAEGYEMYGGVDKLRKTDEGWRVLETRWWPVRSRRATHIVEYNDATWQQLDNTVQSARAAEDQRKLVTALGEAYRSAEAFAAARTLCDRVGATAEDWVMRGHAALRVYEADDGIAAFRHALELDANAPVPQLQELR